MTRRFAFFSDGKKGGLLFVHIVGTFILIVTRRGEDDHRVCLQKKITTDCVRKKYNLPRDHLSHRDLFARREEKVKRKKKKRKRKKYKEKN